MKCAEIQKNMMGFIEKDLESFVLDEVREHIASCQECAAVKNQLDELFQFIHLEKKTSHDPFMFTRIYTAFRKPDDAAHKNLTLRLLQPVSFAAILTIVTLGGILIGKEYAFEKSIEDDYQTELFYLNNIHLENEVIVPLSLQKTDP